MRPFDAFLQRKKHEYGEKFDASNLAPQFIEHFNSGNRIEVIGKFDNVRRGTVGVTTGWKPAFLLMHRVSDSGSSDVLGVDDKVIALIGRKGKRYPL